MQVDILALPWEPIQSLLKWREADGAGDEPVLDERIWDDAPAFSTLAGDSAILFHTACGDTSFFPKLELNAKDAFLEFCRTVFGESFEDEFDDDDDDWFHDGPEEDFENEFVPDLAIECELQGISMVIPPKNVDKLAHLASQIDFDSVRSAHEKLGTEGVNLMGDGKMVLVGTGLDTDEYVDYMTGLAKFVTSFKGQGRCLAMHFS